MPEKCKDCCSRLFCMSVAEVNGEDFETMANKKDCRKRVFTNADRIRAMSDEELAKALNAFTAYFEECNRSGEDISCKDCELYELCSLSNGQAIEWLKQPVEG